MDKKTVISILKDHLEHAYGLLPHSENSLMTQKESVDLLNSFINENYDLVRDWIMHEEAHFNQLSNAGVEAEHPTIPFEKFAEQWDNLYQ